MRNDTFFIVDLDRGKRLTYNNFSKNKCKKIVYHIFFEVEKLNCVKRLDPEPANKMVQCFFRIKMFN